MTSTIILYAFFFLLTGACSFAQKDNKLHLLAQIKFCNTTAADCFYLNDVYVFDNKVFLLAKKQDSFLIYDIAKKNTDTILIPKLADQGGSLFVNEAYVSISCHNKVHLYTHKGNFFKTIEFPDMLRYFFIQKDKHILGFGNEKVYVCDSSGALIKTIVNSSIIDINYTNDGQRVYYDGTELSSFFYNKDSLETGKITIKAFGKQKLDYFLSDFHQGQSVWFNYFKRDTLFFLDKSFARIERKIPLGAALQPTKQDIEIETGDPHLKVFFNAKDLILVRTYRNHVNIYSLKL